MPTVYSLFGPKPQFMSSSGEPLNGGRLYFYVSGSTTPKATYTDSTGTVTNANPAVLNSLGTPANGIWGTTGAYRIVCEDALSNVLWTVDGIAGINDVGAASATEWLGSGLTPTFIGTTSFSVPGDQTGTLTPGRRIQTANTGGTITSRIIGSVFGSGITTITTVNDSGVLDSGLSSVLYALANGTNPSQPFAGNEATVASGTTVNLDAAGAGNILINGGGTINTIVLSPGRQCTVRFNAGATLTNSGTLVLLGGANIETANGDVAILRGEAGLVRMIGYTRANGAPIAANPFNAVRAVTGATGLTVADRGNIVTAGGGTSYTITLPDSATLQDGWYVRIVNTGAVLTISRAGSDTISGPGLPSAGAATFTMPYTGSSELGYNFGAVTLYKFSTTWRVAFDSTSHGSQLFTASGTWTCPLGVTTAWLDGAAAGGGGGGSNASGAGGGGGGGEARIGTRVTVVPDTPYTVTIPNPGGTAGTAGGGAGGTGGVASFGALLSLTGGAGGAGGVGAAGAGGGAGGVGGGAGAQGSVIGGIGYWGGAGGGTSWGPTTPTALNVGTGPNGIVFGAAGAGGVAGGEGGTGAQGFFRVTW